MFASLVKFVGTSLKWTFIVLLVLVAATWFTGAGSPYRTM